ncbi:hypothetical protein AKJ40_00190 [candidate division MSBL1 archaeon SCGC-AAA259M10]|uniref:Major facilitator superfamily (MFS) profile domain-containing protein n=5 Tax=candidate division MSBL1 TaxID=215777 RepID=A0A656YXJ3_9EURY|nr:hypothetical protein AKJ66_00250 [candidate division MSBL1 archaeon SCGC-AAA259E22]KXA95431.1 hypothetical protein AKJ36_00590 [candidate division MSBL1 archaeon SCGC-AAA259I07]KXA98694.1 hypothetical protein AKJ39_01105 [candidate division MSBL1 archaeon SCGC-AAA259J03]KXB00890.1 hypothetical protein AKJ40_00190 [candidate division MSBL1 archaeon SCGC-AAA259M10]KXB03471.1 hypothetical protein AKJ48_03865 [candidate division MSBL1 archaeon SCGC-AAA261O19]
MSEDSNPFISLLRENRDFATLWFGQIVSRIGDGILIVALPWLIYKIGTETDLGLIMALYSLAAVLFGYIAGMTADRFSRKRLMIMSSIGAGVFVTLMPVLYDSGLLVIPLLGILAFLASLCSQFFEPALDASIPNLVEDDMLETANSMSMTTRRVGMIAGPAVAGVLITVTSSSTTLLIDSISFFFLAGIIAFISVPQKIPDRRNSIWSDFVDDTGDLFSYVKSQPLIRLILLLTLVVNAVLGPFFIITVVFTKNVLASGSGSFGLLVSILSLGTVAGMLTVGQFKEIHAKKFILLGFSLSGLSLIILSQTRWLGLAVGLYLLVGIGFGVINVPAKTALQRFSPDKLRGKIMGITFTMASAAQPISQASSGFVLSFIDTPIMFLFMGMGVLLLLLPLILSEELERLE